MNSRQLRELREARAGGDISPAPRWILPEPLPQGSGKAGCSRAESLQGLSWEEGARFPHKKEIFKYFFFCCKSWARRLKGHWGFGTALASGSQVAFGGKEDDAASPPQGFPSPTACLGHSPHPLPAPGSNRLWQGWECWSHLKEREFCLWVSQ